MALSELVSCGLERANELLAEDPAWTLIDVKVLGTTVPYLTYVLGKRRPPDYWFRPI